MIHVLFAVRWVVRHGIAPYTGRPFLDAKLQFDAKSSQGLSQDVRDKKRVQFDELTCAQNKLQPCSRTFMVF